MTTEILAPDVIQNLLLYGDLSRLTFDQKVQYVQYRCKQLGLDPNAKPFELLTLNGKQVIYATAACTQQLCESRKLSVALSGHEMVRDVIVVTAKVSDKDRSTENVGAVAVEALKGDTLANALMKARTKAIRRTVLAHCGLGMMDETEIETIPNATKIEFYDKTPVQIPLVKIAAPKAQFELNGEVAQGEEDAHLDDQYHPDGPVDDREPMPGDYKTPFGAAKKGKKISELTDSEIKAGLKWCQERGKYPEWCDNAVAYLQTSDMKV